MKPIIEVHNLSKQYRIGSQPRYLSLRDSVVDFGKNFLKKKISQSPISQSHFWALDDLNFTVEAGESVGIIGKNGAGKSTLLKILSRITPPTKGSAILRGRLASLLEVGTGFHQELSGRENVFMNGSILGLKRAEITAKFDEIVAFSGVEQFIDTPLKNYSSGMQLRLAFAVAAHLEPEILIIDEVLAVGDAEFQKKCLGKMDEVSRSGRTVLFVSHNLPFLKQLCPKSIWLEKGKIAGIGATENLLNQYLSQNILRGGNLENRQVVSDVHKKLIVRRLRLTNALGEPTALLDTTQAAFVEIEIEVFRAGKNYNPAFEVISPHEGVVFATTFYDTDIESRKNKTWQIGQHRTRVALPMSIFREGDYHIFLAVNSPMIEVLDIFPQELHFSVVNPNSPIAKLGENRRGAVLPLLNWEVENL